MEEVPQPTAQNNEGVAEEEVRENEQSQVQQETQEKKRAGIGKAIKEVLEKERCVKEEDLKEELTRQGFDEALVKRYYLYLKLAGARRVQRDGETFVCIPTEDEKSKPFHEDEEEDNVVVEEEELIPEGVDASLLARAISIVREKVPSVARRLREQGKKGFALMPKIVVESDEKVVVEIWYLKKAGEREFVPHPEPIAKYVLRKEK